MSPSELERKRRARFGATCVARVSPDPLDRPRITRSTSSGHSRAAPVGAQVPWTTWGRFAHDSPRARVEVHLPCVLESRSAGQRALAPPTDGHPPDFRKPQRQFNHYTTISPTIHEPLSTPDTDTTNRNSTTTFSQPFPQLSCNRFPTPHQLSGTSTHPQPSFNRHATANQSQPSFVSNPRTISTQPSHIRDSSDPTTSSCMAVVRPSTAAAIASLPTPPAARRKSPSCRQWCHKRCRRGEA